VLVIAFLVTFLTKEGFQTYPGATAYGASVFNSLGAPMDIMRPNFVQSSDPAAIAAGTALIQKATKTSSLEPGGSGTKQQVLSSPTNLQLPLRSAGIEEALKCAKLQGTSSCDSLGTPEYAKCGVCIKGGKDYTGVNTNYVGGLYINPEDKADLDAGGYALVPSIGQCDPLNGNQMFFIDKDTCKREANRQACRDVTDFSSPGADKCVQATASNTFIYEPKKSKTFNATFRFAAPNGVATTVTLFSADAPKWPVVTMYTAQFFEGQSAMRSGGRYDTPNMGVPNDNIQSLQVGAGAQVMSYEDSGFSGKERLDKSNMANLYDTNMKKDTWWANQISSFVVGFTTAPLGTATARNGGEATITLTNVTEGMSVYVLVEQDVLAINGGETRRGVIGQWEMEGSSKRKVEFNRTVTATCTNGKMMQGTKLLRKFGSLGGGRQMAASSAPLISPNAIWVWNNQQQHEVAGFMSFVPGFYSDPHYSQDNAAAGGAPLLGLASTAAALQLGPCMAAGQTSGNYSQACLLNLFQGAGGDPLNGKLIQTGLTQLNAKGSMDEISDYLNDLYTLATTGRNSRGIAQKMADINDASQKMFGFDVGSPCEDIKEDDSGVLSLSPKKSPLDSDCLNYLWLNTGTSRERGNEDRSRKTRLYNTYQTIGDRYSGLRDDEGTVANRQASPFNACNSKGSMAPVNATGGLNWGAISQINAGTKSVSEVQNVYNQIYKIANYTQGTGAPTDQNTKNQAEALQMCYGVTKAPDSSCI
jgi:hypothetical protein